MKQDLVWLVGFSVFIALQWLPYILERIYRVGLLGAMGYDKKTIDKNITPWADRCQKAHNNAIEGFVVFIPLVIAAHFVDLDVLMAIQIYCLARAVHYICYTFKVPVLRTLAFFTGIGAQIYMAVQFLILSV